MCPLQSWPGRGDSHLLCPGGMAVPEVLMAHVDASMQENKRVSSEPSWCILPTKLSQPPKRAPKQPTVNGPWPFLTLNLTWALDASVPLDHGQNHTREAGYKELEGHCGSVCAPVPGPIHS